MIAQAHLTMSLDQIKDFFSMAPGSHTRLFDGIVRSFWV